MPSKPKPSEKELLELFARMIRAKKTGARGIVVGVGDDAAVLRPQLNEDMLVTTDILVENQHFRRRWFSGFELGWRLAAVNLSDIAAMGGRPRYGVLSLALPPRLGTGYIKGVERGVRDHLAKYGAAVVGGNVSGIEKTMVCDLTLIGGCPQGEAWRRTCRPGRDAIVVVGRIGEARAGLDLLARGVRPRFAAPLIRAFKRPEPRLDVSELFRGVVGRTPGAAGRGRGSARRGDVAVGRGRCDNNEEPVDMIMTGGEDYGLILAVDKKQAEAVVKRIRSNLGASAQVIGRFTRKPGVCELIDDQGRHTVYVPRGWDHLSGLG
jgi:thiamine-monophosphate kinase